MFRAVLLLSFSAAATALAQAPRLDFVDYAKIPMSDAVNTNILKEGNSTYFVAGNKRFKLVKLRKTDRQTRSKLTRERLRAVTLPGPAGDEPESLIDNEPNADGSTKVTAADSVPKKIAAFKSYYDPRTKRDGKAPPDELDYTAYQSPIRDQSVRGSCSAFAATAALEAMPAFRELMGKDAHLSTEYAYWLFRNQNPDLVCADDGASVEDITDGVANGLPLEGTWAYTSDKCPSSGPPKEASDRAIWRPRHTYVFDSDVAIRTAARKKDTKELAREYATAVNDPRFLEAIVAAGYSLIWRFEFPDRAGVLENLTTNSVIDLVYDKNGTAKSVTDSAHFMVLVGYKRTPKEHGGGYFLFKNSWGTDLTFDGVDDGYVRLSYDMVRAYGDDGVVFTGSLKVPNGKPCNENVECQGFSGAGLEGSSCCKSLGQVKGTCQATRRDFAGVWYCPSECRGAADQPAGTCVAQKKDGERCSMDTECEDFDGAGQEGSACCGGKCTEKQMDWAGVFYCPQVCKKASDAKPGTCDELADKGEACTKNEQCEGFNGAGKKAVACCKGKCRGLLADYAGVYYCPSECRSSPIAAAGSCSKPKKGKCSTDQDCSGGKSCCGGKCQKKRKDWAGVLYCPADCVGKSGGKAGSCP